MFRLVLLALLFLSAVGEPNAVGASALAGNQSGRSNLTIHRWLCPLDFASESYSSCLQTPLPGGVFFLDSLDGGQSRVGMTAPDGTLTFDGLADGNYQLAVLPYGEAHDPPRAFCGPSDEVPKPDPPRLAREAFALALSGDVVCEWYELPVSGLPSDIVGDGVPVQVLRCGSDPAGIGPAMTDHPEGCGGVPDVTIAVETEDGSRSDVCVTDAGGSCDMSAFFGEHVVLTLDTATLPDGLVPAENPISTWFYTEFASAYFLVFPEDAPSYIDALHGAGGRMAWPRIEFLTFVCPSASSADQVYADCVEPAADARFEIWQPVNPATLDRLGGFEGTAAADGTLTQNVLGYGEGTLRLVGAAPRDTIERYQAPHVACSSAPSDDSSRVAIEPVPVPAEPGTVVGVYDVPFTPGDAIRCDWFFLPRE